MLGSLVGEKVDQASLSRCIKYCFFVFAFVTNTDMCCTTGSCLKLATARDHSFRARFVVTSCVIFFWCRNEQFQEELWKITVDRLKTFLSPSILEKYGSTQTTTDQPETVEEVTGNVRVGVGKERRRVRGWW